MQKLTKWVPPKHGGAPLLTMGNIVKPLHKVNPRLIMGTTAWKKTREACYAEHNDTCEVCGCKLAAHRGTDGPIHECHECYLTDYETCTVEFKRLCCLCGWCHKFLHSGFSLTNYRNCVPLWTKEYMLELAKHGFSLIHEWNKSHTKQLRVYATYVAWLEEPTLHDEMKKLVEEYDIHFWSAENADGENGTWSKWKLVYDGVEYYSPYEDMVAWANAMEEANRNSDRAAKDLFNKEDMDQLASLAAQEGLF